MKIEVLNRQKLLTIERQTVEALALGFLQRPGPPVPTFARVTVVLTGDREMRRLKRLHFGEDVVTDVISLAYAPIPGECPGAPTADVYVNVQQALRVAGRRAVAREWALYLAHGIDHLRGGRDEVPAGRVSMRRRDLRWVRWAQAQGLLDGGSPPRPA
jgi:ssRNA-specific RNase YbeY (16S rRNA maturation enzyme)